jgi:putative inorganic carbon (HCO3(-)) transporter
LTKRTPFDWPIALLLLMLSVSILVSVDVVASLPKLAGILLGIAVFYAIVNRVQTEQEIRWVLVGLGGAGIAVALIGVLGTQWIVSGKFIPEKVYSLLPRLTINIPGTVEGWIHPNEVGGSLAFIVPFLVTLLVPRWYVLPTNGASSSFLSRLGPFQLRWGLRISLAFSFAVLILSQSRSAIVGVLVSLLVLGAILWRRFRWIVAGIAIVLLLVLSLRGFAPLGTVLVGPGGEGGVAGTLGLADRQEVWERALFAIQDFPFTGLGLNMFGPVSRVIYPYFLVSPDDQLLLTHAHDVYLQVAVDLGIPGLVAYFALLTALGYMVTDVFIHSPSAFSRAVALAVGLGILAHQIFGIADAIALGAKPGIILWMMLALLATVWQRNMSRVKTTNSAS